MSAPVRLSTLSRFAPAISRLHGPTSSVGARQRPFSTHPPLRLAAQVNDNNEEQNPNAKPAAASNVDALTGDGHTAKGRTGGSEPLESSSRNAPPPPKVDNFRTALGEDSEGRNLSEEQRREVEEHNRDFDKRHDRGHSAPEDKVDKKFWAAASEKRKP